MDIIEVGRFIDNVVTEESKATGQPPRWRTQEAIAGRFLEEAVELCLATGVTPKDIMGHVMDSIHNQVGKAGRREGRVIYPTYYRETPDPKEIAGEMADCLIHLKDLAYVSGYDQLSEVEDAKWENFKQRTFYVNENGIIYAIKKPAG